LSDINTFLLKVDRHVSRSGMEFYLIEILRTAKENTEQLKVQCESASWNVGDAGNCQRVVIRNV